ncbi:protein FAM107B-like isoform X2 [Pollicipes pollicipes]|uniref:protein FAM107B-like isoform X2 n=1 Tax=Pollicipes pollicipes TaxID=41117 RepID=UPI00188549A1|nr:protein FAM107B-like isoform X2 [Pollicipes pollicipes]
MSALAGQTRLSAVIPEPDYSDSEEENRQGRANCRLPTSPDGLILPRKLANPCRDSADRRQLHRELLFNQRTGKNVLGQKSELQRAMERHREQQQRREALLQTQNNKSSFERALDERLLSVEPKMAEEAQPKLDGTPEFLKVHAKVRANINTLS